MSNLNVQFEHLGTCESFELNADVLELAYKSSYFPMAESEGRIRWHSPDPRAIFPLTAIHFSRSLRKTIEKAQFEIRFDTAFSDVIAGCSRHDTEHDVWISHELIDAYTDLHSRGIVHSVETWKDGNLVGGLYGVVFGAGFFGESMFSRVSNASKAAFVGLIQHLQSRNFLLLDTQYINHFTQQLGAVEIPRDDYLKLLAEAVTTKCSFIEETSA